jgi:lauroyl/myristoyl acyltransferase
LDDSENEDVLIIAAGAIVTAAKKQSESMMEYFANTARDLEKAFNATGESKRAKQISTNFDTMANIMIHAKMTGMWKFRRSMPRELEQVVKTADINYLKERYEDTENYYFQ